MLQRLLVLLVMLATLKGTTTQGSGVANKVVCYFGGWSVYRPGSGKFQIEDIDPTVCTHLVYAFTALGENAEIKVFDPWIDLEENWGKGGYKRFIDLKKRSPGLKVLVAIGGWNEGSIKYSKVFSSAANRAHFVSSAVSFLTRYGFDGLDLDWEYPAQRGGAATDVQDFSQLCQELQAALKPRGLLLTAAVAAAEFSMSKSYDAKALARYLDFINIMAYDFHGAWENVTGHNAPLYGAAAELGTDAVGLNGHDSINSWISRGAPAEKLVMGVGLYGRSFTLSSPSSCAAPRCPAAAAGRAGPSTGEAGILGYNEICLMEMNSNNKKTWDDEAKVPYLVSGNQWVGYDDEKSAQIKVDYIKQRGLGGAMVWSIDTDDFRGECGRGRFPILRVLRNGMDGGNTVGTTSSPAITSAPTTPSSPTTNTTPAPTTSTSAPDPTTSAPVPTTSAPVATTAAPGTFVCPDVGYFRSPSDCQQYYRCYLQKGALKASAGRCSGTLMFDLTRNVCNWPNNVQC